jgi:hypothetical protein
MTDYLDLPLGGSPVAGDRDSNRPPNANVFPPRPPAHRPPHVQAAIVSDCVGSHNYQYDDFVVI